MTVGQHQKLGAARVKRKNSCEGPSRLNGGNSYLDQQSTSLSAFWVPNDS